MPARNPTPPVVARYGSPMGRPNRSAPIQASDPPRFNLRRIRVNRGGYDSGGAYWGVGAPLYWAEDAYRGLEMWFRASSRDAAKAQVRAKYPTATFYR